MSNEAWEKNDRRWRVDHLDKLKKRLKSLKDQMREVEKSIKDVESTLKDRR